MNAIDRSIASGKPEVCPVEPKPDYTTPSCPAEVAVLVERFRQAVGTAGKVEPRAEAAAQGSVCPTGEDGVPAAETVSVGGAPANNADEVVEENAPRGFQLGFTLGTAEHRPALGHVQNPSDGTNDPIGARTDVAGDEFLDGTRYQRSKLARETFESGLSSTASDSPGAAILQSFLSQSSVVPSPTPANETSEVSGMAARIEKLETVIAETVSRILVSDPLHDARREVRVQFAREVLPDTEVRLWRDAGRLHVEFNASVAVAEGGLREALPRLGEMIQQRQSENALPLVTLRTGDFGGQPQDGRSRQSYWLPQEPEELA
jgi:hypothetical protein